MDPGPSSGHGAAWERGSSLMVGTMHARRSRSARKSRGAAAVELAMVLPILCILLFGIISYGYMLAFRQAVSQSVAEAARAAAVTPISTSNADRQTAAQNAVNEGLSSYGVSCSGGNLLKGGVAVGTCTISNPQTCSPTGSTAAAKCVKVSLDYRYRDHSLIPSFPGLGIVLPSDLGYDTQAEVTS